MRRKWKNLRDSFVRELKQRNSDVGNVFKRNKRKSLYMWFNQLEFLRDLSTPKIKNQLEVEMNVVNANVVYTYSEDTDDESDDGNDSPSKKMIGTESYKKQDVKSESKYIQKNNLIETDIKEMDSDKLFLLSLLDDFKRIPEKHKMQAKCEILNIINKTLQMSESRGLTQTYGYNYLNNYWKNYYSRRTVEINSDPLDISTMPKRSGMYTENSINADN